MLARASPRLWSIGFEEYRLLRTIVITAGTLKNARFTVRLAGSLLWRTEMSLVKSLPTKHACPPTAHHTCILVSDRAQRSAIIPVQSIKHISYAVYRGHNIHLQCSLAKVWPSITKNNYLGAVPRPSMLGLIDHIQYPKRRFSSTSRHGMSCPTALAVLVEVAS